MNTTKDGSYPLWIGGVFRIEKNKNKRWILWIGEAFLKVNTTKDGSCRLCGLEEFIELKKQNKTRDGSCRLCEFLELKTNKKRWILWTVDWGGVFGSEYNKTWIFSTLWIRGV